MRSITISGIRNDDELHEAVARFRGNSSEEYVIYAPLAGQVDGCGELASRAIGDVKFIESSSPPGSSAEQFELIECAFQDGSAMNVALLGQAVIAPDAFDLINWFHDRHVDDYLCLCLSNPLSRDALWRFVRESREFSSLCWCCGPEAWRYWLKPVWPSNGAAWRETISDLLRTNECLQTLIPMSSRAWEVGKCGPGREIDFVRPSLGDERSGLNYSLFRL